MLTFNPKTLEWEGVTGGVDVVELDQRKPKPRHKQEITKEQKRKNVRSQIENHPVYGYADQLARKILAEYGYENSGKQVIFTNKQVSCFHSNRNFWQVKLSYHSLDDSYENGFCEYFSVAHVWAEMGFEVEQVNYSRNRFFKLLSEKQAVWAEILHEMAHFVDMIENKNTRKPHGQTFKNALKELVTLYPYSEC